MDEAVRSVAFSPDGKSLASSAVKGPVRLWDAETCKEKRVLLRPRATVFCVAYSPDGKVLAAGGSDGTVWLWEAATLRPLPAFRWRPASRSEGINVNLTLAFSPDSKLLASCGRFTTRGAPLTVEAWVWDLVAGKQVATVRVFSDFPAGIAFSPDGKLLAVGDWDGAVRLWDVRALLKAKE